MKFRFCGDADCPDWVLAEINSLSKLSSIKLKSLAKIVVQGIVCPPIDANKSEKLFADSKIEEQNIDLKACVSCISFILSSATRFSCDSGALHTELQQLGLPREHSTAIKKVYEEQSPVLNETFREQTLKVNPLESVTAEVDKDLGLANVTLTIGGKKETVTMTPNTVKALIDDLKMIRNNMVKLKESA